MSGLTAAQQAVRRTCVTASGVAAILGLHPYRSAIDEWMWLVHGESGAGNENTDWGTRIEPVVREWHAETTGLRVIVPGTLVAEDDERHGATPDGVCYRWGESAPVHGLEIKQHGPHARWDYGAPGTDEVPEHELLQCLWNCRVCGVERWALAVTFGGPPRVYWIERDYELEQDLRAAVNEWWERYVVTRAPPPPDGSESYGHFLRRQRAADIEADAESIAGEIAALRAATGALAAAKQRHDIAVQRVQAALGAATRVTTPDGPVTWRSRKDGTRVFRVPKKWRQTT